MTSSDVPAVMRFYVWRRPVSVSDVMDLREGYLTLQWFFSPHRIKGIFYFEFSRDRGREGWIVPGFLCSLCNEIILPRDGVTDIPSLRAALDHQPCFGPEIERR